MIQDWRSLCKVNNSHTHIDQTIYRKIPKLVSLMTVKLFFVENSKRLLMVIKLNVDISLVLKLEVIKTNRNIMVKEKNIRRICLVL